MKNLKLFISNTFVVVVLTLLLGCSTLYTKENMNTDLKRESKTLLENTEPKYEIDFKKLEELETDPPNFIYLTDKGNGFFIVSNEENFDVIAISSDELYKLERLIDLKNTYKNLSKQQYELIKILENKVDVVKDIANYQYELVNQIQQENKELKKDIEKNIKWTKIDNIALKLMLLLSIVSNIL